MNADEVRRSSAHLSAQENLDMPATVEKQTDPGKAGRHAQPADQSEMMIQDILKQISESVQRRVRVATLRIRYHRRRFTIFGWDYYPCLSPEIRQVCDHFRRSGYRVEITKKWFQKNDIRNVYICW